MTKEIDKIEPYQKKKCPKCGGDITVFFGVASCEKCKFKKDLYEK